MQWALDVISHGVCETCSLCPPGDLGNMASEVMRVFIYVVIALRRPCGQALIYTALSKVSSQKSFALHGAASSLRTSFKRPIRIQTLCIPPDFTVFSLSWDSDNKKCCPQPSNCVLASPTGTWGTWLVSERIKMNRDRLNANFPCCIEVFWNSASQVWERMPWWP